MGMTMGQLMKGILVLFVLLIFWLLMIDHVGLIGTGLGFVVSLVGTLVLSAVKIGGVRIPPYLFKMTMMMLRRPAYVADAVLALQVAEPSMNTGAAAVVGAGSMVLADGAVDGQVSGGLLRRLMSRGKKQAVVAVKDPNNRYMAKAQFDSVQANALVEGRRQMRSLLKEFRQFLPKFRR